MPRKAVALVGLNPAKVDFATPDHERFSQLGAEGIQAMLERDRAGLEDLGFHVELVFVDPDVEAAQAMASRTWHCVLIGSGVRSPPNNFLLFEALINVVHEHASSARICFNTKPDDSSEAVRRWIDP